MAEPTQPVEVITSSENGEGAIAEDPAKVIFRLETEIKGKEVELLALKKRIQQLEEELAQSQKYKKESEQVETLKNKSEDTLTRAKSIIFDQTKVIKNQELQMEALNQQIGSLKDVVAITKDLLEIRNLEVKQLETKIQCIDDRTSAERERHDLMHKKLEQMIRHNGELKREYETQLCLFSALRERYNERELAKGVVDDNANASTEEAANNAGTVEAVNNAGTVETANNAGTVEAANNGEASSNQDSAAETSDAPAEHKD